MARFRRLKGNLLANSAGTAAGVLFQVISVPLFLHFWGKALYGEWLVLTAIPAYLALTDFGLGTTLGNTLALLVGTGRRAEARQRLQTVWVFQLLLSAAILLIMAVLVRFGDLRHWLALAQLNDQSVALITLALATHVLLSLNYSLFAGIFRAEDANVRGSSYITAARILEFGATLTALINRASPVTLAGVMLAARAAGLLLMATDAHRRFPGLRLGFRGARWQGLGRELWLGVNFLAVSAGQALMLSGMPLVVNHLLGAVAVANFTVIRAVCRIAMQAYAILYTSMWPEVTRLMAANAIDSVKRLNRTVLVIGFWTAVAYAAAMLVAGRWILSVWTHGAVVPDRVTIACFVVPVVLSTLWTGSSVVISAVNEHVGYARLFVVGSALSLVAGFLLVPWLGYGGAGLAVGCTDLLVLPYVLKRATARTGDTVAGLLRGLITPHEIAALVVRRAAVT